VRTSALIITAVIVAVLVVVVAVFAVARNDAYATWGSLFPHRKPASAVVRYVGYEWSNSDFPDQRGILVFALGHHDGTANVFTDYVYWSAIPLRSISHEDVTMSRP
jgi:hypothetical protein